MPELAKGTEVSIQQVANGYIVHPYANYERGSVVRDDEVNVFQSFVALEHWLSLHFTHRDDATFADREFNHAGLKE